ncbi:magnesium and cobalt transport protein CorA [Micropruina sonneratiae]|uniref:magnesium and cobalt transport protein CorA n=1 Tax=Micropruina sonneratiae TaxID=2986940 RepID=UPI00222806C0|nr:magnesium and cobalt transport protein CorA [Micropruina sp. KQZ13P-5]MCW3156766.1 magnesium and cobalt transport protein CorA [Micropruina sp. KQZ13P-5]
MTVNANNWDAPHSTAGARGERHPAELVWMRYKGGRPCPSVNITAAVEAARAGNGYVWIGLHKPSEHTMETLGGQLGLHELAIEDAVHGHRRSKLERFDDNLFVVVSTVAYEDRGEDEAGEIVTTGELMIFLGEWFVMTSRHSGPSRMPEVRAEVEQESDDMPLGPSRVLYACLSVAIDDFERVAAQMEEDVEDCEQLTFGETAGADVELPYEIKRELIEFRRCVGPLGAPLNALASREFACVPEEARPYFRELAERVQAVRETIGALEDQLTNILQAALARASFADNRDMRKISAAVAILAVPTTLGAIYGMNFDDMPELHWRYGYFVVLGVSVVMMLTLYLLFRRFKWL